MAVETYQYDQISIHALREEGDVGRYCQKLLPADFYPRPPRGGRLLLTYTLPDNTGYFYPRPPRGGRPYVLKDVDLEDVISIHALREEGDDGMCVKQQPWRNFYPRPPRGGRLLFLQCRLCAVKISIHALREEGDAARGRC